MYSRKVQQSLIHSSPNLKSVILDNNAGVAKSYFLKYTFMIRQITFNDACKNLSSVRNKMRMLIQDTLVFHSIRNRLTAIPRHLKDQSSSLLRVWSRQCECVFAQKIRRGQQMFCLYSKLWQEHALRELINRMRQQVAKRGKEFMLSAVGVTGYNWKNNRISDQDISNHMNDLEYIYMLKSKTICCDKCDCKVDHIQKSFDNWVPFIQQKDLIVWRRLHSSGCYEYKVYGSYNDVTAVDFLNVQIDTDYRKNWDTTAIALEVIEQDPDSKYNSDIVYWEMLWPRLFANRDYVFKRRYKVDLQNKKALIASQGTDHPLCPIRPEKFRVKDYWSYMVIKPYTELDKPGIEFGLTYFDNPGVNIPSSVTTWVAFRAMPDFLSKLREASKKYKKHCENLGVDAACILRRTEYESGSDEKNVELDDKNDDDDDDDYDLISDNTISEPQIVTKRKKPTQLKEPSDNNIHPATNNLKEQSYDETRPTIQEPNENETQSTVDIKEPNENETQPTTNSTEPNKNEMQPTNNPKEPSEKETQPASFTKFEKQDSLSTSDLTVSSSVQADTEIHSNWKYLHPRYYFS